MWREGGGGDGARTLDEAIMELLEVKLIQSIENYSLKCALISNCKNE
jgi:hypothetical protein